MRSGRRQFYCAEGRHWIDVEKEETVKGARRRHAEEHTAEAVLFASAELTELDAMLEGFYGGSL